ncbi:MAG TPA: hypothetical protein VFE79_17825 [Paraburkholderia sp.]|nr:hypothetical protein [Paraburkholderia sp.]
MHTSSTVSSFPRPPLPRAVRTASLVVPLVVIQVTVPAASSVGARHALHAALGDDLRLYVITVDRLRDSVTFRVEVTSRTLDDVIGQLTAVLGSATLGRAQTTSIQRTRHI